MSVFRDDDPKVKEYPYLNEYTSFLKPMERELFGRDREMDELMAAMMRPELCNVILLAEAGSGKTALVQGTMKKDPSRAYLEVDLPKMISNLKNENEMADKLKQLFAEVAKYRMAEKKEIVLFIDEFHQIVQLSAAAVEVLKPLLADSGTRGIRVIAATTFLEYNQFIASNQPLVERLQRINLAQTTKETVVRILKNFADRYGCGNQFRNNSMFELIYEYTNRYIPASAQPRKSILILDNMIGWHRYTGEPIDTKMLADVIYRTQNINIALRYDPHEIKRRLDDAVFAQGLATACVTDRLQICCADLNNKSRPMSSFLFCGSTGVGKTELSKCLAGIMFESDRNLIRMDMTEYALEDSLERFREELTRQVWARPFCIVLLDEIEKACAPVSRLLLQVLDDGRLLDRNNMEVTFKNCYIIITTNAGAEIFKDIAQYAASSTGTSKLMEHYEPLIRESIKGIKGFPPELLGRIDCLVPFQPLALETMKKICTRKLDKMKEEVKQKHGVILNIDRNVVRFICEEKLTTESDAGGARIVVSMCDKNVLTIVSTLINDLRRTSPNGRIKEGTSAWIFVAGEMRIDNKNMLESDSHICASLSAPIKHATGRWYVDPDALTNQ